MAGNYYDREFDPWVTGIRNIGTMIAEAPLLRQQALNQQAQAQERAQRGAYYSAEVGRAQADATKAAAEAGADTQETAGRDQLSKGLRRLSAAPNDPDAIADVFEGTGKAFRKDPAGTAKGLGALLAQIQTLRGGTNALPTAAQLASPNDVYDANSKARSLADVAKINLGKPVAVTRGGSVYDPESDRLAAITPQDVAPGHELFTQAPPASPASGGPGGDAGEASPAPATISATPAATGGAMQPKSSALETTVARQLAAFIQRVTFDNMTFPTPATKQAAIDHFRQALASGIGQPADGGLGNAVAGALAPDQTGADVSGVSAPGAGTPAGPRKPTRALAAQYVEKFGKAAAIEQLKADGYDPTGYAD